MSINEIGAKVASLLSNEMLYLIKRLGLMETTSFLVSFLILVGMLFIIVFWQVRRVRNTEYRNEIVQLVFQKINPSVGMEKTMMEILNIIRTFIKADGYYFYLSDTKSGQYILKAVRHSEVFDENIAPSYTGLLPFKKEEYLPPLTLNANTQPESTKIIKEGKVPLLVMPLKNGVGQIRLGPVRAGALRKRALLDYLVGMLGPLLEILIELDKLRGQTEMNTTAAQAVQNVTSATADVDSILRMTMDLSIKMVRATGGAFLFNNQGKFTIMHCCGLDKDGEALFNRDAECHTLFDRILEANEFCVLSKNEKEYYELPAYFAASAIEHIILISVGTKTGRSIAAYCYKTEPQIEMYCFIGLQMMTKRMGDLLDYKHKYEEMSESYIEILKTLVRNVDNLEPYTVGYSELMARYTEIIAREMKVENKDIKDMVLAAHLSNIGVLGFKNELLFKEGKYSEQEYEMMKLHAEVGASIIETTIANSRVALYIRHHHERIDGNGYPEGLVGDDIPLGSRIIAVVQTFLAKINSRKYRDSLSYENAIEMLRSASGKQLDASAVNALISWFEKKQNNPARKGHALGPCWEMRCSPVSICQRCPAYKKMDINCWEIEGTLCKAHGNRCQSCFVYTEYLYRAGDMVDRRNNNRVNEL